MPPDRSSHEQLPPSCRVTHLQLALVAQSGSQLHDYLQSRVCLRPMGFDPMLNVLSVDDAVRAIPVSYTHLTLPTILRV